jgi:N6-L-threonylcarbamoyladenine synthase
VPSAQDLVLGVESSCDEMAAAVVRGGRTILSNVIHGQADLHAPYGGVVPELASRDHVRAISRVVQEALTQASVRAEDLAGIAVTVGPGLIGSLLVGLSFAKALAYRFRLPLVGVHHLSGHLASIALGSETVTAPHLGLVVSGGHTALYRLEASGKSVLLGETRDDAVGECFDKVAKLLGLPYPGGPSVSAAASGGNAGALSFPRPLEGTAGLDFSYSGLKTAVALEVKRRSPLSEADRADLAASFEAAATDVLIARTRRAVRQEDLGTVVVVGGVAANRRLREGMVRAAREHGFRAVFPPPVLCTDNAAMIAAAGWLRLGRGERDDLRLNAFSRSPLAPARALRAPA